MSWRERAKKITDAPCGPLPKLPEAPFVSSVSEPGRHLGRSEGVAKSGAARPVLHFRLTAYTCNSWATCIGRSGQTDDDLRRQLDVRFGAELVEVRAVGIGSTR
jgi:hypothetical protein